MQPYQTLHASTVTIPFRAWKNLNHIRCSWTVSCAKTRTPSSSRSSTGPPEWGGKLAGTIALLECSPTNLSVEIGVLCILPAFQQTHIATHAVGALLQYYFSMPCASQSGSGLGLRRVHWYAHPDNEASLRLAARMGLKREGTMGWVRVLPVETALGKTPRKNDLLEGPGRNIVILAISWEDWEGGAREIVTTQMARAK